MTARVALLVLSAWLVAACQVALGDFTIDTSHLAVSCESGRTRCDGSQIETCVNGNEWRTLAGCASPDLCNLLSLSCVACQPGSYQCNAAQPEVCGPDQHWSAATPAPCASSALCQVPEDGSPALCLPAGCPVAGQMQCSDGHLQRCPLGLESWQDIEICASAALCDIDQANAQVAAGQPATCLLPACGPGQFNCDTGSPRPCNVDRSDWGAATVSCAGTTCNPDKGDCSECTVDSTTCSGPNLERCNEQKIWTSTACSSALSCTAGALPSCTAVKCTPGEFRCDSSALERCRSDGTDWEPIEQCLNGVLCNPNATRCEVPGCPVGGAKRCQGNTQQICRIDLTRWDELDQCPTTGACDPDLGCLATPCNNGDYRCNDVSLESCSNGTWTRQAACATPALCDAKQHLCTPASCAPGERQCQGDVLRRCNAALDGWDELETCNNGKFCNADTKRCEQH